MILKMLKQNSDLKPMDWGSATYTVGPDRRGLKKSIQRSGIIVPLVIMEDGTIIDGLLRWKLAKELGIEEVPVVVAVGVDEVEALVMHVELNRHRGDVVARSLSVLLKRVIASKRYTAEALRRHLVITPTEMSLLMDGSVLKARNIAEHSYSPSWVPIESETGEDVHIEKQTGVPEQI